MNEGINLPLLTTIITEEGSLTFHNPHSVNLEGNSDEVM